MQVDLLLKSFLLVPFLSLSFINSVRQKPREFVKYKAVKCTSSNKTLNSNYTCKIKAYNRYTSKLAVLMDFVVPMDESYVRNFIRFEKN
jgi:hypothetical protein